MYMYVAHVYYMYVCMYVYMYMYVYIRVYVHTCVRTYMYVCMYVSMVHICMMYDVLYMIHTVHDMVTYMTYYILS